MITQLNQDMLAQYRGCSPENECYHDCCDAARYCIDEQLDAIELDKALKWAKTQNWI